MYSLFYTILKGKQHLFFCSKIVMVLSRKSHMESGNLQIISEMKMSLTSVFVLNSPEYSIVYMFYFGNLLHCMHMGDVFDKLCNQQFQIKSTNTARGLTKCDGKQPPCRTIFEQKRNQI